VFWVKIDLKKGFELKKPLNHDFSAIIVVKIWAKSIDVSPKLFFTKTFGVDDVMQKKKGSKRVGSN
jgi:hypothetical protein